MKENAAMKKVRPWHWMAMVMLVVLLVGVVVAGFFWPRVVAALTLPQGAHERTVTPTAAVPSPPPTAATWTTHAGDTFNREDQRFCGEAADGQLWGGDANTQDVFSISDGSGQITNGSGTYDALLGPVVAHVRRIALSK